MSTFKPGHKLKSGLELNFSVLDSCGLQVYVFAMNAQNSVKGWTLMIFDNKGICTFNNELIQFRCHSDMNVNKGYLKITSIY